MNAYEYGGTIISDPPNKVDIGELLDRREKAYSAKSRYDDSVGLRSIEMSGDSPVGILHMGDPHLDDDGTDIATLRRHIQLVQETGGLYVANVGDITNNWIGRLARCYGEQTSSASEAWTLAEWFIGELKGKIMYLIGGNHDAWSGSGDPLKWIARAAGTLYSPSEVRVSLDFPSCKVTINARHDFRGNSQYNPAHGPMKAALFGYRDDINVCGHKHISGYGILSDNETGRVLHCIQVASYKRHDNYAKSIGARPQFVSSAVLTIINPLAELVGRVTVYHDIEAGVKALRNTIQEYHDGRRA